MRRNITEDEADRLPLISTVLGRSLAPAKPPRGLPVWESLSREIETVAN
jgi:hypothetical protein